MTKNICIFLLSLLYIINSLQAAEINNNELYLEVEIIPNASSLHLKTPGSLTLHEMDSPFQIKFDNPELVIELYEKIKATPVWKVGIKKVYSASEALKFINDFPETYFVKTRKIRFKNNQILQENVYSIYKKEQYKSYEAAKEDSDIDNWIEEDVLYTNDEIYLYDLTTGQDYYITAPFRLSASSHITVFNVPKADFWNPRSFRTRTYYESMLVKLSKIAKLNLISVVELEKYVAGVVPNEIGINVPMEALKTQAIAARSEALFKVIHGAHKDDGFDLCASVHCQVYSGITDVSNVIKRAVESTSYQVAKYDGKIINAVYSTNCGGLTVSSKSAWGGKEVPYLQPRYDAKYDKAIKLDDDYHARNWLRKEPDVFCNTTKYGGWISKTYRWLKEFTIPEFEDLLNSKTDFGKFENIEILARGNSGRVSKLKITGTKKELILEDRLQMRQILGGLRSTFFLIVVEDKIKFFGKGSGHGVGLCQRGAIEMARQKYRAEEILKHYFSGIVIEKINLQTTE